MEKKEKVYMSSQLVCMLPPSACKVFQYILGWQSQDSIKYYSKQYSKMLHMDELEVELAIQTLVDNRLLEIGKIDQTFILNINKDMVRKYFDVPLQKVHDHEGFKMSTKVTWNVPEQEKPKPKAAEIEDMDESQLQAMILRLQASLNEKQQMKKLVKMAEEPCVSVSDGLPF